MAERPRYYKNTYTADELFLYVVFALSPIAVGFCLAAAIWTGEWRWLIGSAVSAFILRGFI